MLKFFVSLPLRKRVGLVGILLGFIAIFAPDPYHRTTTSVNTKEIAMETLSSKDQITVEELADWIIHGKMDFRLIDLRTPGKYNEYNIPESECVTILKGGLEKWGKEVLYPAIPEDASPEELEKFKKKIEVAKFFGGEPQTGSEGTAVKKAHPKPKAPAKITLKRSGKKKKREGC